MQQADTYIFSNVEITWWNNEKYTRFKTLRILFSTSQKNVFFKENNARFEAFILLYKLEARKRETVDQFLMKRIGNSSESGIMKTPIDEFGFS